MRIRLAPQAALIPVLAALSIAGCPRPVAAQTPARAAAPAPRAAPTLEFKDFFEATPRELRPTARLSAMNGVRVRLVGFMARLDAPILGAFYLCPSPTFGDEEGGGTADLPPQAVRVVVSSYRGRPMPFVPGPVSVTGVLHLGPVPVENDQVSLLQLTLDRPAPPAAAHRPPAASRRPTAKQAASRH